VTNFKSRAAHAATQATTQYKEHKKDQPSWKPLSKSLDDLSKLVGATLKTAGEIFAVGVDKKEREKLSIDDAKKQIKALMPKLQKMDDAAMDVLSMMAKVKKETKTADMPVLFLRAMETNAPMFVDYYSRFKIDVNSLK
jgi:hypothetical protein